MKNFFLHKVTDHMISLAVCIRECVYGGTTKFQEPSRTAFFLNKIVEGVSVCSGMSMSVWSVKKKKETKNLTIYTLTYTPKELISFG